MDTCSPSGGRGCEEACHQLLMTLGLFPLDLLSPREILRGKERFFSFFFFLPGQFLISRLSWKIARNSFQWKIKISPRMRFSDA